MSQKTSSKVLRDNSRQFVFLCNDWSRASEQNTNKSQSSLCHRHHFLRNKPATTKNIYNARRHLYAFPLLKPWIKLSGVSCLLQGTVWCEIKHITNSPGKSNYLCKSHVHSCGLFTVGRDNYMTQFRNLQKVSFFQLLRLRFLGRYLSVIKMSCVYILKNQTLSAH